MKNLLLVGLGGALGSMLRYLATLFTTEHISCFPAIYGTLAVNVIGSLLIGVIYGWSEKYSWFSPQLNCLFATGLCGGFTTFSAFAGDNVRLLQHGHFGMAAGYILLSVVLCIAATFAGTMMVKTS
ncbi:MAG: fluoride efflux transporter CrcB [Bacteroidales bacterium]|jgi:CrcB protein|nr:fluoride efflux transporter CrcB [Bacteroidales bacterium]